MTESGARKFNRVRGQKAPTAPSTRSGAPVAAVMASTVVSDARSRSTRPDGVTSITAISVTIKWTTPAPVSGSVQRVRIFGSPSFDKKPTPRKGVRALTPVTPSKIIAVGLNYADHAREQNKPLPKEPLIWIKATTSLIPDGAKIEVPYPAHRTDYEAELAIVIGRKIRNVTPASAARYILGYTAAQDISDRTIQNSESQWCRAKSFDTFTPLGPYVETKIDPTDLNIQLFQTGQLRQNSNTRQMIFNCFDVVSFISQNMTLLPGDVILTGTPAGVGPIQSGDRLEVRISGLSPLINTVK